jgi:hypothetical protein
MTGTWFCLRGLHIVSNTSSQCALTSNIFVITLFNCHTIHVHETSVLVGVFKWGASTLIGHLGAGL